MANFKEWLLENLIACVKKGIFAREYASILATNYLLKGIFTEADIQRFIEETEPITVEETSESVEEQPVEEVNNN